MKKTKRQRKKETEKQAKWPPPSMHLAHWLSKHGQRWPTCLECGADFVPRAVEYRLAEPYTGVGTLVFDHDAARSGNYFRLSQRDLSCVLRTLEDWPDRKPCAIFIWTGNFCNEAEHFCSMKCLKSFALREGDRVAEARKNAALPIVPGRGRGLEL